LRGWAGYFKLSLSERLLEDLYGWVRHKLRCIIWQHRKQPSTSARILSCLVLTYARACIPAFNGPCPSLSLGAPHMNQALPEKLWDRLGLVSILDTITRLSRLT
ncbi:group II intron maturase-specific domain-containing protein, partial [Pseudomonas fluorescens]|uniref:group II intron maturase-specific domain-containing protein n=1 Tax=Pseudomonas fluorescens TaxID=294 RepID=UPI002E7BF7B5